GSDYPFPLGEERVGALIRESQFPADVKTKLLGANAQSWLGLSHEAATPSTNKISQSSSSFGCPARSAAEGANPASKNNDARSEKKLTYSSYLQVPELLRLQHPESSPEHHDELLFIIVHQTYELWFKELLHDLDAVVANLQKAGSAPQSRDEV